VLHHGSLLDVLPTLEADSFTACVTDPPYHLTSGNLSVDYSSFKHSSDSGGPKGPTNKAGRGHKSGGFMGKAWDGGDVAMRPETWAEVLRVLKPGAHLLAFGGTRTYHRICCAIEDAGFEIRDCIMWIYGSGFPKSLDVSKAIDKAAGAEREVTGTRDVGPDIRGDNYKRDNGERMIANITTAATDAAKLWSGYGTALKPAYEPVIVARKPLSGTVAANCLEHGCGALNIDGCRVGTEPTIVQRKGPSADMGYHGGASMPSRTGSDSGRWPANVIRDGSEEVLAGFPSAPGQLADISNSAPSKKTSNVYGAMNRVGEPSQETRYAEEGGTNFAMKPGARRLDSGSAARFFYCAKASKSDRGEGNTHPTVKPLKLMEYLVKLVTMPGENRILDPFAGSGTTLIACDNAGIPCVGVELEAEHVAIINGRREANKKNYLFN